MNNHPEGQSGKVIRVKQFDEFTKYEKDFTDPELEKQIDASESEPGFAQRIADRALDAIKSEEETAGLHSNVIGRRRIHRRLHEVTLANHGGETAEAPEGKVIQFRPRMKKT